jgi:hypothetical protein
MIIVDLNYCKRCRRQNTSSGRRKTNYCHKCLSKSGQNTYQNRYRSSDSFISTSFIDSVDGFPWSGFQNIKYSESLIEQITDKFSGVKYVKSSYKLSEFTSLSNNPLLYLVSDTNKELLKIGQTVNPFNRFGHYHNISEHKPIKFDLFITANFEQQDLYEDKIRNYLEFLGYVLPKDNTNSRLKYI